MNKRRSGILIHPTSFTGPYGSGDLGNGAYKFLDWLKKAGQRILQVLPLGPTGYGDSPYQAFSAFAGTPYIISFDKLYEKGYLSKNELSDYPQVNPARVDYALLYHHNFPILYRAYERFKKNKYPINYEHFVQENSYWLNDYALFMAIKDVHHGASWNTWEKDLKEHKSLGKVSIALKEKIEFYQFLQWEFNEEWLSFKKYAESFDIMLIGDIPIFLAYDSADVWANQRLFYLDKVGNPTIVAGVPPDYFSTTGQLWGNPIYRWDLLKKEDFSWWKKRISHLLNYVDRIRIDHFRGFKAYWAIPYGEKTAINGKWVDGLGDDFFRSLEHDYGKRLRELIIAEDLGVITEEIKQFRDHFHLPGMKVVEFANFPPKNKDKAKLVKDFSEDEYLPENFITNCLAYPGTHDNDTLQGWFQSLESSLKEDVLNYFHCKNATFLNYTVIEALIKSKAETVIFLMQDVLELGSEHRMNHPSTCGTHNWSWRLEEKMLTDDYAKRLEHLCQKYGRFF